MSLSLPTASPMRVVVVGAGRVGTAVAHMLHEAGHEIVAIASRTRLSAERAAARMGAATFEVRDGLPPCDLALIATNDDVIEEVAELIARGMHHRVTVCHFAGAMGTAPLSSVAEAGGRTCALHPVASCPTVEAALRRLPGCAWGISGDPDVRAWATLIVERDLRGRVVEVREEDRAVWHVAAVMTANGVAALLSSGEHLLARARVAQPAAVLGPLCAGVIANAGDAGTADAALTGPVVRGDTGTITRHVNELRARAPDLAESYVLATRVVLAAALRSGSLDASRGREVERVLESAWT
jgi:predicted short-subunit dehydrogenase-like oxidoreductase (DUF2520 family)